MRTVKLNCEVADASGLFLDLIKAEFEVEGISVEKNETRILLADEEDKDPSHVVQLWMDRGLEKLPVSAMQERMRLYESYLSGKDGRRNVLRARKESVVAAPFQIGFDDPQVLDLSPAQKTGWIKKLFKLW